ncbi:MAG: hypothetical protein C3F11_18775 [Methylocystaceae bacterium]|nr:MAG: hypothetical protein C3F11_18775 [Methylocystaceae bacterium]
MKKAIVSFLSGLAFVTPAIAGPGDAIFGVWVRGGHTEKLEFFDCEGRLCARGTLMRPDGSPPPLILRHATKTEPNKWKGDLFNPENSKIYSATITLDSPTQLTLTGCLIAFLCQSETWSKIPVETPSQKTPTPRRRITNP